MSACCIFSHDAWAASTAKTFSIRVPANATQTDRDATLVVTGYTPETEVSIIDTDEDGDSDDSMTQTLGRGEVLIVRIRDGVVDDGAFGIGDGDHFWIEATAPVSALVLTQSDWQHDWVPSQNGSMRGTEFFVWSPIDGWDIDVVAYDDNTQVQIREISTSAAISTGTIDVDLPGKEVLRHILNRGEDLLHGRAGAGVNLLRAGHVYHILSSHPTTVLLGALQSRERDAGALVPGESGSRVDKNFYFPIPSDPWQKHEREVRILAGAAPSQVSLLGKNASGWENLITYEIPAYGYFEATGRTVEKLIDYSFFQVTASEDVQVLMGNWLDVGHRGTSDALTAVMPFDHGENTALGTDFTVFVWPPTSATADIAVGPERSWIHVAAKHSQTSITLTDIATGGQLLAASHQIVEAGGEHIFEIDASMYADLSGEGDTASRPIVRVVADNPISMMSGSPHDSWMAFAPGLDAKKLSISLNSPDSIPCGEPTTQMLHIKNPGLSTIENVYIDVGAIGEAAFFQSRFEVGDLPPLGEASFEVTPTFLCDNAGSGALVGTWANGYGIDAEDDTRIFGQGSGLGSLEVASSGGILSLDATQTPCAVDLSWATDQDFGGLDYRVLRREADTKEEGVFVEIAQVSSREPGSKGCTYTYRDRNVDQFRTYEYLVRAVSTEDGRELSVAGGVRTAPGETFSNAPILKGNLVEDFAEVGVILEDSLGDVSSDSGVPDGYDVDKIAYAYDAFSDVLYLAASAVGILGDGDGDGDGDTNTIGEGQGVIDRPRFSVDEGFAFVLDFDEDGEADAVAGIPFGGDIDFAQATPVQPELIDAFPTLAFVVSNSFSAGSAFVEVLNYPRAGAPDLEIVVRNASALNDGALLEGLSANFFLSAPSIADQVEWAPGPTRVSGSDEALQVSGCGTREKKIRLSSFAAFGNASSGPPDFEFLPLGWALGDGRILAEAPSVLEEESPSSPTVFLGENNVDVLGTLSRDGLDLARQELRIQDGAGMRGTSFLHGVDLDWNFSPADGGESYENIGVQVFRLFVLDCSAKVVIRQMGTSGILRDNRFVTLADGSQSSILTQSPAAMLIHSGIGNFSSEGSIQQVHFGSPEDRIADMGPETSEAFTPYAFLNDVRYLNNQTRPQSTDVYPIGEDGVTLEPGLWFVNHYLWSYANEGASRIETLFEPGDDCLGSF